MQQQEVSSDVTEIATHLQHLAAERDETAMLPLYAFDDLSPFAYFEVRDVVQLPHTATATGVIAVKGLKKDAATDEWMYELEQGNATDPYLATNTLFRELLSSKTNPAVISQIQEKLSASPTMKELAGCRVMEAIINAGSVDDYLKLQKPQIVL